MTTTFKVKLVSQTNAGVLLVFLFSLFVGGMLLFFPHGMQSAGLSILVTVLLLTVTGFLWQRFVTGRTEWTVDNDKVAIVWTKPFAFTSPDNIVLKWTDIEDISKGMDPHYYNLKFKLVSGGTVRFIHDYMTMRDDFNELLIELYKTFGTKKSTARC